MKKKSGIWYVTKKSVTNKVINDFAKKVSTSILDCLIDLGEKLVERAKASGQYRNITGNLRSSVGYVIANFGKVIKSSFKVGRRKGTQKGRELAFDIASKYTDDEFVLVVVAGMEYATKVEARGKDVLTSTEIYAQSEIPRMLESLKVT